MKTVSSDRTYVDYTTPRFGVRVRRGGCRTVLSTASGWEEYGEEFTLPVPQVLIDPTEAEGTGYDLSMNVADYESFGKSRLPENAQELRAVLLGEIAVEAVLGEIGAN